MSRVIATEVMVGNRRYRIAGDRVWVQGFGTTGPGQQPHYSWLTIDKDTGSYREAMESIR